MADLFAEIVDYENTDLTEYLEQRAPVPVKDITVDSGNKTATLVVVTEDRANAIAKEFKKDCAVTSQRIDQYNFKMTISW